MKKSKHENSSELEDGVDRISSLPDPILQLILSRIPTTEEIMRTSVLSTRWRYFWKSLPIIDIDSSRGSEFDRNKFKKFVDHVLSNNSIDLDNLRLSCSHHYNQSTIWRWVQAAVNRNIKQLHLLFCCGNSCDNIELPSSLMNCNSLQVLRLSLSDERRLSLSIVTGFHALRVLELNKLELSRKQSLLKKFLESIPLLEDLSLIDCEIKQLKLVTISCRNLKNLRIDNRNIFDPDDLFDLDSLCGGVKIDCPKLVVFEFGAFVALKYSFKSLGSLKKAVIHPEDFPEFMDYSWWNAGICHLECLSTSIDILLFSLCLTVELKPPFLPNIKTLKLTTGVDDHKPQISKLVEFLTCHPHLESLHLIIEESYFQWEDWKLDEADTCSILTRHLKKVEFVNFNKQKLLVDITRLLLEHGNALEEMVFRWDCDEAKFDEKSTETMNDISNFQKGSSTVKLIFLNEISYYQLSGRP